MMSTKQTQKAIPSCLIECINLNIGYQEKQHTKIIAQDINLNIPKGKLIALIGENGIGKSTLLKTLTKIQKPLSGSININGVSIEKLNEQDLAKEISLVLTEKIPSKNLSVYELISLGRQPHTNWIGKLKKQDLFIINEAINKTDLSDVKDRKCHTLSDGQMQRVMIARCLAQNTPLIFLDEPTTHLDLYHRISILKLLKDLSTTTQKTILFSTHEIELALELCDMMIVMKNKTLHYDTPQKLIDDNVFDDLFPKNLIQFDKVSHRFKTKI